MVMKKRWTLDKVAVATAVDSAEDSSGHQILVHLGDLARNASRRADAIAARNPGVSLLLCVDMKHRLYEVRWASGVTMNQSLVHEAVVTQLAHGDVPAAITSLASLLPQQTSGDELPDIEDDTHT
jgi:hypothetical protein